MGKNLKSLFGASRISAALLLCLVLVASAGAVHAVNPPLVFNTRGSIDFNVNGNTTVLKVSSTGGSAFGGLTNIEYYPTNTLAVVGDLNVISSSTKLYPSLFVAATDGNTGVRMVPGSGFALDVNGDVRVSGAFSAGSISGMPTDSTIDANVEAILASRVPWADVNVSDNLTLNTNVRSYFGNGFDVNGGSAKFGKDANFWQYLSTNRIYSVDNNTLAFYTNGSQRVTALADGNVGIGIATPQAKLHIYGGNANSNVPPLIIGGGIASNDISDLYVIDSNNANTGVGYAAKVIGINIQSQVDSSNQILQRTTWSDVTGAAAIYLGTDDVSQGGFGILTSPQGSSAGTVLSERFTVKGDGKIGIGTVSPNANVDINGGTSSARLHIFSNATNNDANIDLTEGSGPAGARLYYDGSNNRFNIATSSGSTFGGLERFTINRDDGNVGIDDTSPDNTFQVGTTPTLAVNNAQGRVGIGVLRPANKLTVLGDANFSLSTGANGITIDGPSISGWGATTNINNTNGVDTKFNSGTLYVDASASRVGIGTGAQTDIQNKLTVVGDLNVISSSTKLYPSLFVAATDGNTGVRMVPGSGFALDVNGDVRVSGAFSAGSISGMPTDSTIDANVEAILALRVPWADVNVANDITINSSKDANFWNYLSTNRVYSVDNNTLSFFTNGSERAIITTDGNVGIGTVYPTEKFTVMRGNILLDANSVEKSNMIYYRDSTNYGSADTRNNGRISVIGGSAGRLLNRNPDFIAGNSAGYLVYDNSAGGKTTISVVSDENAPNSSGYKLRIAYDGTGTPSSNPSPGYGGFYPTNYVLCTGTNQSVNAYCYRPGQRIMERIWAQIPVGYTLEDASNLTGTSRTQRWLTPTEGTGKWEEYIYMQTIGVGGTFLTTGHKMISSGTNQAFDWNVALYEVVALDESPGYDRASSLNVGFSPTPVLDFGQFSTRNDAFLAMGASTEYVGVGIGSPAVKLDINSASNSTALRIRGIDTTNEIGDIFMGSAGELIITTRNTGDSGSSVEVDPEDNDYGLILRDSSTGSSIYANLYTADAAVDYLNIVFGATNTTAGLVIDDEDQVGIGTVNPNNKLNVIGDLNVITSTTKNYPSLHVSGTDGNTGIRMVPGSTFALDVNGDVRVSGALSAGSISGMPTDSQIDSNVEAILALRVPWADVNVANDITIKSSQDANFWEYLSTNRIYSVDNNSLALYTNGSQRVTVLADGNVGIGAAAPSAKLDVAGDVNLTGSTQRIGMGTAYMYKNAGGDLIISD